MTVSTSGLVRYIILAADRHRIDLPFVEIRIEVAPHLASTGASHQAASIHLGIGLPCGTVAADWIEAGRHTHELENCAGSDAQLDASDYHCQGQRWSSADQSPGCASEC